MAEIDDYKAFGDFLSQAKARTDKKTAKIEEEIGVKCTAAWHNYEIFPARHRLPAIALAYEVDLEELTAVYEKAKAGRRLEKISNLKRGSERPHVNLSHAANFDLPSSGRAYGKGHSYRNSGGR